MAERSPETKAREWLDRLEIRDLVDRYSDAVTRCDWRQCESLFAPDATWESPKLGLRFESSAAFMEFLTATSAYDLLIQTSHSSVITLTGDDRAGATTTMHELTRGVGLADTEFGAGGAEVNVEQYGIYHDRFARIDGEWKFTRRIFEPVYADLHAVTGDVLTQRSAMVRPD